MQPPPLWSLITALCSIFHASECINVTKLQWDPVGVVIFKESRLAHHLSSDCDKNSTTITHECPKGMVFDASQKRCIKAWDKRKRSKRQTAIVGIPCQENIDCQTTDGGAYCDTTKRCDCLAAYINLNGYCWPKKNPGESCAYQDQCTGASPNSYCHSSGVCMCLNNQRPTLTDDGPLCLVPGECPTNGANPKLRSPSGSDIPCDDITECTADPATGPASVQTAAFTYYCLCPLQDPEEISCAGSFPRYCCPRRALACIQSKDEGFFGGGGIAFQARWWYNSASGTCEPLNYRGAGGNANNFQNKALCETYCKTACPRGNPGYTPPNAATGPNTITTCSVAVAGSCPESDNYYCVQGRTTYSMCCPRNSFICRTEGGTTIGSDRSPNGGDVSFNSKNVTRYYYDGNRCQPFTYYGQGGNFNNFHTEAECRTYCASTICRAGEPLRDSTGDMVQCGAGCPAKYTCTDNLYCCPSVDFVCGQPQSVGACSSFAERWWFNPATRSCEKFFYSGCQGNFNNFATYQDCVTYCGTSTAVIRCPQGEAARDSSGGAYIICSGTAVTTVTNRCPSDYYCHFDGTRYGCCPTRTKTCSVDPLDPGTACITRVTRWYYNSQNRLCEIFTYNGCDGNSNNFATKIDCQDYCGVGGCPDGGEPFREAYNGQYRICGGATDGTECPSGFVCTVVTMGTQTRRNHCCPTKEYVCSLGQDAGQRCGTTTLNRYFFNSATRTCEMFVYNGCAGNRNNFETMNQCLTYCNSAGCSAGQVALQDANTRLVTTCDQNVATSCPTGYTCVFSNLLRQGICCGSNAPAGACPSGQNAYMDSFTSTALQCQPNVDASCPNGIFCQYSAALQNAYCCHIAAAQCSQGGSPYLDPLNSQPMQCTPGLPNACPSGYTCQTASVVVGGVTSTTGYCCGLPNICGTGFAPYYLNNQPVVCVVGQVPSACPAPYTCRQSATTQQSYCCGPSSQSTNVCAAGKQPYLTQGVPTLCIQSTVWTGCPPGYTCDLYAASGSSYCCGTAIVTTLPPVAPGCPAPYVLLQPVQTCTPGSLTSCPANYFCSYDAAGQRYVCCGTGVVVPTNPCPNNGQAYINPATGQAQVCILGSASTGCPSPYGCAYSSTMWNYYCCSVFRPPVTIRPPTGDAFGCPTGVTYLYPGSRTPLACRPTSGPSCPVGYTCMRSTRGNAYQCCSSRMRNVRTLATYWNRG